jgi:UDP-N-acetylglucosamine--N-acetylmuramyl-(pentapeptide) pyrophosphoryl-undecaprenol N-acetylglucosamine transferase
MNERQGAYVIVAGKTGGHIFPGIALGREIRARRPDSPILFVGTRDGLESRLIPEAGFPLETVSASGFIGKSAAGKLLSLSRLPLGFLEARALLSRPKARAVAGMGGYVSVPVLAAARSLGIPTVVHDSNALPGTATKVLNRFATRTAVGFARSNASLSRPGIVTGTPVRSEFFSIPPLSGSARPRRLLVFGGSQGSAVLNRAMTQAAPLLAGEDLEVIHQTGEAHYAPVQAAYREVPASWRIVPFLPRIFEELAWADLVLSRSGAMTLAELSAAGRPAILVPFGSATHGHQRENALALVESGAARMIEEPALTGEVLAAVVREVLSDRAKLLRMAEAARTFAVPDAAARLADLVFEAEKEFAR